MTTTRPEIVIEGSADGQAWREYVFRYKPGPLSRTRAVEHSAPAAARLADVVRRSREASETIPGSEPDAAPAQGSPPVLALFDSNPFPDVRPSTCAHSSMTIASRMGALTAKTGQWWVRRPEGLYFPQVSLSDFRRLSRRGTASPDGNPG